MGIDICEVKRKILETSATNRNDLYNSHLYWSQKPFNICDVLIENFSSNGDVILDPFMGSGVTLIQSLTNQIDRKAVGVEINEVPIFIIETLLNSYNIEDTITGIEKIVSKVNKLNTYYETKCIKCGEKATIMKTLFDRKDWKSEPNIRTVYYKCSCSNRLIEKEPHKIDIDKMNITHQLRNVNNDILINNSRLAVAKGQKIGDIFTKRNLAILDIITGYLDEDIGVDKESLKYIILSIIHLSKITDTHSNSQWPLWTPKKGCIEKNVPQLFEKRAKMFIKSIKYAQENLSSKKQRVGEFNELEDGKYLILKKGTQNLTTNDIPYNSVDLIITDPPYLGQVLYSEYMQLYKPFLKFDFNLEDEIVVSTSPERDKKEEEYYDLLEKSFKQIANRLKTGKYMCMYFHDSNLDVWDKLINILQDAGLRYLAQVHVPKKSTLKNIISPKRSLNGDAILFFIKDSLPQKHDIQVENVEEMERNIIKHAKYMLNKKGPLTTPELYDDGIMELIIHNGWLSNLSKEYKSLIDIFEKYLIWDCFLGKWRY